MPAEGTFIVRRATVKKNNLSRLTPGERHKFLMLTRDILGLHLIPVSGNGRSVWGEESSCEQRVEALIFSMN